MHAVRLHVFILLCAVWLAPGLARAATTDDSQIQRLAWLSEGHQQLTVDEAHHLYQQGKFQPADGPALTFGIGAAPHWLALTIHNPQPQVLQRRLVVGTTWLDQLDLYLVGTAGPGAHWLSGDTHSEHPGLAPALGYRHRLQLPSGDSLLLLRVATPDPQVITLVLADDSQLERLQLLKAYLYGLLYGFLLALCGYNLMLWLGLRERSYLYYVLYLSSLLLCNVAYTGHGLMWLWPNQVELQRYIILALMVQFTAFGLLFAGRFLELERLRPHWLRPLRLFAAAAIGGQLLLIWGDHQHGAALLAFWAVTLFSLLMILLGLSMVRSHPGGRYFLLATLFGGLGAGITSLTVWGQLPYTQLGYHAFEWGVVFEATLLALALARQVRHYQQLSARSSHEARHDLLTGLLNRRGFIAGAQPLWSTANRRQRPLSLLMVDLDHFKAINDSHGHAGGDQALQAVARLLAEQSREGDLVGRWGGEEFVVLLPETSLAEALVLAERLRLAIAALPAGSCGGATLTASLGVAGRNGNTSLEQLVAEADRQLYLAKEQGRNRVCVSPEPRMAAP